MKAIARGLARDWDLYLLIVIGALMAFCAHSEVTADNPPACDAINAVSRYEVSQEAPPIRGLIWYCNLPTGYKIGEAALVTGPQLADRAEIVARTYVAFGWRAAWKLAFERKATADETAFLDAEVQKRIVAGTWPTAKVKASTASDKARGVMLLQNDGTLAAYKVGATTQRILQALPCSVEKRVPGTIYFNVAGQKSITGNVLSAAAYAECTVTPPET